MDSNKTCPKDQSWLSKFLSLCKAYGQAFAWVLTSLILVYLLNRISFSLYHADKLQGISATEWVRLYFNAFRFDFAAIAPFLLLLIWVSFISWKPLRLILWVSVTVGVLTFVLLNGADSVLIEFTGRRFSKSSLVLVGEGSWTNLLQFVTMAGVTFLLLSLGVFGSWKSWHSLRQIPVDFAWTQKLSLGFLAFIFSIVSVRGGLQLKPMSFVDAKVIDHAFAHQVVLNSTFTFFISLGKSDIQKNSYFPKSELTKHLNLNPDFITTTEPKKIPEFKNYNVVFFILESFSQDYFADGVTPFLYGLKQKDAAFFEKAYANGRRSMEGIAALLAGIPALMESPFINSQYATNEFIGLGQLFKNKNYHTSFFHGAVNGSMRFDQFTKTAGFDHYYGKNEFLADPSQPNGIMHDDGTWGIYDEPLLKWACETQSSFPTPFISSVFTLTSHHPFEVPAGFEREFSSFLSERYKNEVEPFAEKILTSVAYTDSAIKTYFECAQTKPWFEKTLFIFVGDHTGPSLFSNPTFSDMYHVMLGFYSPSQNLAQLLSPDLQYAQQIDVLPTLNDLFRLGLLQQNHLSRSLLKPGQKGIALYSDHNWELVGDVPEKEKTLMAVKQYFSEAMVDNRLYYPGLNK